MWLRNSCVRFKLTSIRYRAAASHVGDSIRGLTMLRRHRNGHVIHKRDFNECLPLSPQNNA